MDTSHLRHPKPRPRALDKADRRTAIEARDTAENAKVRARSGGICEVYVYSHPDVRATLAAPWRCSRRALHVHHRIGGIGKRGRGDSALAANKLAVCNMCHRDIHAHTLVADGPYFRRVT